MKITRKHLRRIITEEIRDLVDGTPLFITDMGQSMKITSGDAVEELGYDSIPRYAVWGYHASKGKPQVIDGSDDVQELLQRHGEHLKVTKLNESRDAGINFGHVSSWVTAHVPKVTNRMLQQDPRLKMRLQRYLVDKGWNTEEDIKANSKEIQRNLAFLNEAVDPQKLYDRMQELDKKYGRLWFELESVGPKAKWGRKLSDEDYEEMLAARDEASTYDDFFFDSRVSGNDPKKRKMQPMYLLDVWKQGYTLEEIKSAWKEYSELKPKFKFDHTPTPDDQQRMARVRRTVYIHDDGTEEIIGSTTLDRGSPLD